MSGNLLSIDELNSNINLTFDKSKKDDPSFYSNIVGFLTGGTRELVDPLNGDVFLHIDKTNAKDPKTGESLGKGIHEFSTYLLEAKNISFAYDKNSEKSYVERTNINGDTFLGIYDAKNKTFASAQYLSDGSLKPIENQDDFNAILCSTLFNATTISNNYNFQLASEARNIYTIGQKQNVRPEQESDFISDLSIISKAVYEKFFSPTSSGSFLKTPNKNIQSVEELKITSAQKVFGDKEFKAFNSFDTESRFGSNLGTLDGIYETFCLNKSPELLDKIHRSNYQISEHILSDLKNISAKFKVNSLLPEGAKIENPAFYKIGPSGSGKTFDAELIADFLGLPFATHTCSQNTTPNEIFESKELQGGSSVIVPSSISNTLINGGVVLIDEVNNVKNKDVFIKFNELLANGMFTIGGHLQKVSPQTVIIFCGNLGHQGTVDLPASVKDRLWIELYHPMPAAQLKMLAYPNIDFILKLKKPPVSVPADDFKKVAEGFCDAIEQYNNKIYDNSTTKAMSDARYITSRQMEGALKTAAAAFNPKLYKDFAHCFFNKITSSTLSPLFSNSASEENLRDFADVLAQQPIFSQASIDNLTQRHNK